MFPLGVGRKGIIQQHWISGGKSWALLSGTLRLFEYTLVSEYVNGEFACINLKLKLITVLGLFFYSACLCFFVQLSQICSVVIFKVKDLICVTIQIAGKLLFRVGSSKLTSVSTQGRNLLSAQRMVSHQIITCGFQNRGPSSTKNVCAFILQQSIKALDLNFEGDSREERS